MKFYAIGTGKVMYSKNTKLSTIHIASNKNSTALVGLYHTVIHINGVLCGHFASF